MSRFASLMRAYMDLACIEAILCLSFSASICLLIMRALRGAAGRPQLLPSLLLLLLLAEQLESLSSTSLAAGGLMSLSSD
ncbi:hypothetical protein LPJ57_007179 [Coemansia sp. RSA 486]|nr:hypothetical protein LPJ57_007179 [Coemansia sp. RSA 486]